MPLPKGVFPIHKKRRGVVVATYWYHQDGRSLPKAQRGPLTRLPEPNTPEWFRKMAELSGDALPAADVVTVAMLAEQYKARKWPELREASKDQYDRALRTITKAWGHLTPDQVTVAGVTTLQDQFINRPAAGNQVMKQVRAIMRLAVQKGLRTDNPAREIDMLREEVDGAKPLTPEAWTALRSDAAPVALRRFAYLGRATGQRIGDLVRMRSGDREDGGINLEITKLREKPHWCPLSAAENAEIDGWRVFGNGFLIGLNGRKPWTDDAIRVVWNDFAATDAGAALRGFTPHDLRATKVCDDRINGHDHGRISARVGMSVAMVARYSRHIDQKLAAKGNGNRKRTANLP